MENSDFPDTNTLWKQQQQKKKQEGIDLRYRQNTTHYFVLFSIYIYDNFPLLDNKLHRKKKLVCYPTQFSLHV